MVKKLSSPKVILLCLCLALLTAACGSVRENWAGISSGDKGEIFVAYEQFVAKLDSAGKRQWTYPPKDDRDARFYAPPTIAEDAVYIGDYKGGVHAIDRETGEALWVYEQKGTRLLGLADFGGSADRVIGSVTVGDGVIFVPDEHGVFLLDQETGKRQSDWFVETDRSVWSQPLYIAASETVPTARLYVTSLDHFLYAVNPEDAEVIWKTDVKGAMAGSPVFDAEQNLLYVATFGSEIVAVDAEDGQIVNTYTTHGWVWDAPAFADNTLYFGDLNGYLYSITLVDGQFTENWTQQTSIEGKIRATPLVTEELVVVGSHDGFIYSVDRETGEAIWDEDAKQKVVSGIFQVTGEDEPIVVTASEDSDRLVIGLRMDTGKEIWSYKHKD